MRLQFNRIGECFFCTKVDATADIGSASPRFRCCRQCVSDRGLDALRAGADEANAALKVLKQKPVTCGHCGEPLIQPPGNEVILWCGTCEEERKALAGGPTLLPGRVH